MRRMFSHSTLEARMTQYMSSSLSQEPKKTRHMIPSTLWITVLCTNAYRTHQMKCCDELSDMSRISRRLRSPKNISVLAAHKGR